MLFIGTGLPLLPEERCRLASGKDVKANTFEVRYGRIYHLEAGTLINASRETGRKVL